MKYWRLTPQAEKSLFEIARWTLENFGEAQTIVYRDALIDRLNQLASGVPPHARSCGLLLPDYAQADSVKYYREGRHYIILREENDGLVVLEFFHERTDLPIHIKNIIRVD